MPYQIIYSSESATPMQMDELEELLEHARRSNAEKGITGALIYVDGVFLQILEGDMETVQELMGKISKDFRHETVTVLKEGAIPSAAFSDWEMAYVSATQEQVAEWAGLSGTIAIPEILTDMRQDPRRATQVAASILSVLVSKP
ncbi:MAG TPA: BLUF domain-containing protein [Rubrivivax sp.]|nr:BLUF domain-containing protein [Rubrivivax sp.]